MPDHRTVRGFIIGRLPFSNTSLILRALTREAGRLTFLAKGATRPKSPFAGMIDLFYLADFLYAPSRSGEMHTVREVKLVEGPPRPAPLLRQPHRRAVLRRAHRDHHRVRRARARRLRALRQGRSLTYAIRDITWRAVERFEQRVLELHGIAQLNRDLPHAFHALHHKVPSLRADLLRQLAPTPPSN